MKPFNVRDYNKPRQFHMNCNGCILAASEPDQIIIIDAHGNQLPIGPKMYHQLSVPIYNKILEAAAIGGTVHIPDFDGLDDDEKRIAVEEIKIDA